MAQSTVISARAKYGVSDADGQCLIVSETVGTGRHLSPTQLKAWTGFLDASRLLEEVLARHLAADNQITHREYEVLVRLDGHGGRLRMSQLAQQIVASPALVTQTIDRLEQRHLVERQAAASGDGRGVEAVILPRGREALAATSGEHAEIIRELLLDRVGQERLKGFADAVDDVAAHLRAHRRGESCERSDCPVIRFA